MSTGSTVGPQDSGERSRVTAVLQSYLSFYCVLFTAAYVYVCACMSMFAGPTGGQMGRQIPCDWSYSNRELLALGAGNQAWATWKSRTPLIFWASAISSAPVEILMLEFEVSPARRLSINK